MVRRVVGRNSMHQLLMMLMRLLGLLLRRLLLLLLRKVLSSDKGQRCRRIGRRRSHWFWFGWRAVEDKVES